MRILEDTLREFITPRPVPLPSKQVVSVACGSNFVLVVALNEAGIAIVYSAGNNGFGQLGNGRAESWENANEENQLDLRPVRAQSDSMQVLESG